MYNNKLAIFQVKNFGWEDKKWWPGWFSLERWHGVHAGKRITKSNTAHASHQTSVILCYHVIYDMRPYVFKQLPTAANTQAKEVIPNTYVVRTNDRQARDKTATFQWTYHEVRHSWTQDHWQHAYSCCSNKGLNDILMWPTTPISALKAKYLEKY